MTEPTLRTENLLALSWPIFFQHTTHSLVLLVDFWFFSHLSDQIAGTIGQLLPIVWMGTFVIPVFAGTGVSVASQFMGAKRFEKVIPTYMANLCCTASMGTVYALLLSWFSGDVGRWMGMDTSMNAISTTYLSTMSLYFVFMGVLVAYNAVLSSRGMTHWLMYSAFVIAGLNLVLVSVFVLAFKWQIRGVVLASVISVGVGTAFSVWLVHGKLRVRFYLKGAREDMLRVIRPILRIGVSNALEPFSYSVQQIILSTMIIALGVISMASNSYAARIQMFQITFSVSLGLASQILMAHWMGAERFKDVDELYWKTVRWATCVAAVYAALAWLFSDTVLGIFTEDPSIKHLGKTLLLIAVLLEPARAVNIVGGFALKTVGDARFPLVIGLVFIWGILPVAFFLDRTWGIGLVGLWICFALDEIIRAGVNLWRWRTGKWKGMGIAHS